MSVSSGMGTGGIVSIPIPPDGATGLVLTKQSSADYDTDWDPAAGGGGQTLTLTLPGNTLTLTQSVGISPLTVDLSQYLRVDTSNDPLTGELVSQNIIPGADQTRELGLNATRFIRASSRLGVFVGSSLSGGGLSNGTGTRTFGTDPTGLMAGNQTKGGSGTSTLYLRGGSFKGTCCVGNASAEGGGNALLSNEGGGSALFGSTYALGTANVTVRASGFGSFTCAYAYNTAATGLDHIFDNQGSGSFLVGYSQGIGPCSVTTTAAAHGSFLCVRPMSGDAGGGVVVTTAAPGAFLQGVARTIAAAGNVFATMTSYGYGSFVQGQVFASAAGTTIMRASGDGAFAQGTVSGAGAILQATGNGAFAQGRAATNNITASGSGSFAHGDSTAAAIVASATNSAQFGAGTNALADSLQVGNGGIRFKGTTGAPGAPQDGDLWVNGGFVYVRSNGTSIQIAGPGPLTQ